MNVVCVREDGRQNDPCDGRAEQESESVHDSDVGSGAAFSTCGRRECQSTTHSACHFCIPFVPSEAEPMILRMNTAGGLRPCETGQ